MTTYRQIYFKLVEITNQIHDCYMKLNYVQLHIDIVNTVIDYFKSRYLPINEQITRDLCRLKEFELSVLEQLQKLVPIEAQLQQKVGVYRNLKWVLTRFLEEDGISLLVFAQLVDIPIEKLQHLASSQCLTQKELLQICDFYGLEVEWYKNYAV